MFAVHLFTAIGVLLVSGCVVAVGAALLRRWPAATRVARTVTLAAAITFGGLLLFAAILLAEPRALRALLPSSSDPSHAARALGELIANLMNCGALSVLAGLAAAPIWFFAKRRLPSTSV